MQVFVINLATAADRLDYMTGLLGGEFERIEAVSGRMVPDGLAANFSEGTPLLPGEVGCYASHLTVAETILARDLPYAVVLEDDVDLVPAFRHIVEAAVSRLDGPWDILSLSGAKQRPHCRLCRIADDNYLVRYLHFPKTTAAYVISQSGCKKLLATRRRMRPVDVDIRYGWEMGLVGYGVFPPPAWQANRFASSIPKSSKQRFYWRTDPLGYLWGRSLALRRLGLLNLARAYISDFRMRRSSVVK